MTELEMIKRHVAEGKARIARQIQLITDLRERGTKFWVDQAVDMLETMGQRQRIAVEHLMRLEQERNTAAGTAGSEQSLPVETVDIPPTLAALIGLSIPAVEIDGHCIDIDPGPADSCAAHGR
jgi:arylsulfatase A-like enzyme